MILSEILMGAVAGQTAGALPVETEWTYLSDDPLVVGVYFIDQEVNWDFSLDLLLEAFTSQDMGLYGEGDVLIMPDGCLTRFRLSNESNSAVVSFNTEEVRDFLDQIDDSGSSDVISQELDEFLETL
ncbi:SsgA family sporulation/cell division regulator [Streptomyces sp. NPDC058369]|uniref:SsgA family sporulation/cell division regulator n=1 Tax=Streptomyces sp. NPDC058369 TaxID=3346462 RepID=UPI00365BC83A